MPFSLPVHQDAKIDQACYTLSTAGSRLTVIDFQNPVRLVILRGGNQHNNQRIAHASKAQGRFTCL
jgi:hypothetical protein